MAYKVIIAEKPSVASSIAHMIGAETPHRKGPCGYLEGNGYRVTWAFGHLVTLQTPEEMGFSYETLPTFPTEWKTKIKGKKGEDGQMTNDPMVETQMKTIETLFNGASEIIVATDAGREGELIFRYIYEYLNCTTPFKRLWISSLTDEAIRNGMKDLQPGQNYDNLSNAAHARSQADWLVGYNASKSLRLSTGFKGRLSLGRVQTPTLGMICERFEQNRDFKPQPYWQIQIATISQGINFNVLSEEKYISSLVADMNYRTVQSSKMMIVEKVEKKRTTTRPPFLYDLTALQRAANSKYGLTADITLKTAQSLYEKKYLSYPRTGSRYIPEDVYKTLPTLIAKFTNHDRFGNAALNLSGKKLCRKSVNDSKVTDHHALLPTGTVPTGLTDTEKKIFDMVCGRMLEAFGEDYIADVTNATFLVTDIRFKAHGSIPVYMGWKAVYGSVIDEENQNNEEDPDATLPELNEGELLCIKDSKLLEKKTKPLPIYTDSSLLGEMETCGKKIDDEEMREAMKDIGLGTPATRAATIEGLILHKYVTREGKKLIPTDFGLQIWHMVKGRKIADVQTTGEWERDLRHVEEGTMNVLRFNDDIKRFTLDIIEDIKANSGSLEDITFQNEPKRTCPCCGKTMKNQRYSISCECGYRVPREVAKKKLPDKSIEKLCQGQKTGLIKGFTSKAGKKFDACLVPDIQEKKISFSFGEPSSKIEGLLCPFCGKEMADTGNRLTSDCGFIFWKTVCKRKLTEKEIKTILSGKKVHLTKLISKTGKEFSCDYILNMQTKSTDMSNFGK